MKILVVDDDSSKLEIIRNVVNASLDSVQIDHSATAFDALSAIAHNRYDLLLLDILLPWRENNPPEAKSSFQLLSYVNELHPQNWPGSILGITAEAESKESNSIAFENFGVAIWVVNSVESKWKEQLRNLLQVLKYSASTKSTIEQIHCCVINALDIEAQGVACAWSSAFGSWTLFGGIGRVRNAIYKDISIANVTLDRMGPVCASLATQLAVSQLNPSILLMTGICGGISGECDLGDVVVAQTSWEWQTGKWDKHGQFRSAPEQERVHPRLLLAAKNINEVQLAGFWASFKGLKPPNAPRLHFAPMASGSSVVAADGMTQIIRQQHRKVIGIDMESSGFYFAARSSGGAITPALCVKAVSDLADASKSDIYHQYCSELSAFIASLICDEYFSDPS